MLNQNINKPFATQRALLYQLCIILIIGSALTAASLIGHEVIQINGGFGYDGKHYAELAADFPNRITQATDTKYLQRSAPSLLVYGLSRLSGLSSSPDHIILLFSLYNLAMLLLGVYAWNRICRVSGISLRGNWLGFGLLFISFGSLKFPFFYPTLTDVTGFVLSLFLVLCYKTTNKPGMLLIMLLGALSWPALEYMCLALLLFKNVPIIPRDKPLLVNSLLAFFSAFAFAGLAAYLIYRHPNMRGGWQEPTWLVQHAIIPSLLATFITIFLSLKALLKHLDLFKIPVFRIVDYGYGFAAIVLFLGIDVAVKALAKSYGIPAGYSLRMYFNDILIIGSRQPFCFLVGHLAYFGPVLGLCILRWKQICALVYQYGWPLFFIVVQALFFMLDSESRHSLNYLPFFTFLSVQVVQPVLSKPLLLAGLGLSFLFSKVWISIFRFPTSNWSENYNINFGCYLTDNAYLVQLLIFTMLCGLFYYLLKKQSARVTNG